MHLALDGAGRPLEPTAATLHVNLLACINTAALALHYMRQPTGPSRPTRPAQIRSALLNSRDPSRDARHLPCSIVV